MLKHPKQYVAGAGLAHREYLKRNFLQAERIRDESSVVPRAEVRESGLVTRCAWCGRFRDGGRWVVVDPAQASVEQAEITHGICGDCVEALRAAGMSV